METNITVTDLSATHAVHSYIFTPCIVYGRGTGFGNPISIQTVAIVKAARAAGAVYATDPGTPIWPVCHIDDNTALYVALLRGILGSGGGKGAPPSGKQGFYLASSGSVAWRDLYKAMAGALKEHGVIKDADVRDADDGVRAEMAKGMGCPPELVGLQLGGKCTFTAKNGENVGWQAKYGPEHVVETAGEEVKLILDNLK